jgi:hypothetical protein
LQITATAAWLNGRKRHAKLDKYRKYLVAYEQRKHLSDSILDISKTAAGSPALPFEGTTPHGKKVRLTAGLIK